MPNIEELRRYAVLDQGGDMMMLQACMDAAIAWFGNAGVKPPEEANRLYDIGVYMLATHYFDNRGVAPEGGKSGELPFGVFSIMHQLRN